MHTGGGGDGAGVGDGVGDGDGLGDGDGDGVGDGDGDGLGDGDGVGEGDGVGGGGGLGVTCQHWQRLQDNAQWFPPSIQFSLHRPASRCGDTGQQFVSSPFKA